jgi:hypothetical protein
MLPYLHHVYTAAARLSLRLVRIQKKKTIRVEELNIRETEVYKEILNLCPTDERVLAIHNLIQSHRARWSGRTLDALVTRFPRHHNTSYWLDTTAGQPAKLVTTDETSGRTCMLFDIADSYRHKMFQYSKTYFDCFARGPAVLHQLGDGQVISVSLCQFMFFIWADVYRVFEFLESEHANVLSVKKKNTDKSKLAVVGAPCL